MKKIIFTLMFCFAPEFKAFAEGTGEAVENIPVNNTLALLSAAILLLGIIAVSAFNGYAYSKKNLRKLISPYRGKYRPNRNYTRSDNAGNRNTYNENLMQQQMNDEFNRHAMEESIKAVTPFDHGGYVQGAGFNPSDTAAQQMNDMNNMGMF